MREGSLFSGYNGLGMAVSEVFGSEPAWFSEIEPGPSKILEHHWPDVPNLGDITEIDWDAVEAVDILSGGFPCTDVSLAGRRAGLTPHTRSGLWNFMAYGISKIRPRYVVIENVRGLLSAEAHSDVEPCPWCLGEGSGEPDLRALGAVLGDLAGLGVRRAVVWPASCRHRRPAWSLQNLHPCYRRRTPGRARMVTGDEAGSRGTDGNQERASTRSPHSCRRLAPRTRMGPANTGPVGRT